MDVDGRYAVRYHLSKLLPLRTTVLVWKATPEDSLRRDQKVHVDCADVDAAASIEKVSVDSDSYLGWKPKERRSEYSVLIILSRSAV